MHREKGISISQWMILMKTSQTMLGAIIGDIVGSVYEFANTRDYNKFEDSIRKAIALGGDSDTLNSPRQTPSGFYPNTPRPTGFVPLIQYQPTIYHY